MGDLLKAINLKNVKKKKKNLQFWNSGKVRTQANMPSPVPIWVWRSQTGKSPSCRTAGTGGQLRASEVKERVCSSQNSQASVLHYFAAH